MPDKNQGLLTFYVARIRSERKGIRFPLFNELRRVLFARVVCAWCIFRASAIGEVACPNLLCSAKSCALRLACLHAVMDLRHPGSDGQVTAYYLLRRSQPLSCLPPIPDAPARRKKGRRQVRVHPGPSFKLLPWWGARLWSWELFGISPGNRRVLL